MNKAGAGAGHLLSNKHLRLKFLTDKSMHRETIKVIFAEVVKFRGQQCNSHRLGQLCKM